MTFALACLWILIGGHASAEEPQEWVGELSFTLDGGGSDHGSDGNGSTSWSYDEALTGRCTIRFCGKPGNVRTLGVYRTGSWSKTDRLTWEHSSTRCKKTEVLDERTVSPGSWGDAEDKGSGSLSESPLGSRWTAVKFDQAGETSFRLLGTCQLTLDQTLDSRSEDYNACTGWSVIKEIHFSPGAERSPMRSLPVEGGSHTVLTGPSNPRSRALLLPPTDLQGFGPFRGSRPTSSVEGPGGMHGGKYVETIDASWDIQRATSGCGCIATIDRVKGDVLINGKPVESSIVADASRVEITTGRKGRVTLNVGDRQLNVGGNATLTVEHLCDPMPHTPEAWEQMTPAEVFKDVFSMKPDFKRMRGWIFAKTAVLVGAETDFKTDSVNGGSRGHLDPTLRSKEPDYRLASYTGNSVGSVSAGVRGLDEVMPLQADLDAALGGVILGAGPEEESIAIWPIKGTVRVMDPMGRKATLVAPESLDEDMLPDPTLFSAAWVLVRISG